MRIDIPNIDQAKMLDACIDNMDDIDRKKRLNSCKADIVVYSNSYAKSAGTGDLSNEIIPDTDIIGNVRKEDMIFLYDSCR